MRSVASLTALALLAGAPALAAQQPARVTVTPFGGYFWSSPIFKHDVDFTASGYRFQETERLAVAAAPRGGVRVDVGVGSGWFVAAEGAYGTSDVHYTNSGSLTPLGGGQGATSDEVRVTRARQATFALQGGRHFPTGAGSEVAVSVGGGVQRFNLDHTGLVCPPSLPPGGSCPEPDPWASHYSIPSAMGGVAVRQALGARIGLEARGNFSVGRANTESFFVDFVPEADAYEAPKHFTVRTAEASIGVVFRP